MVILAHFAIKTVVDHLKHIYAGAALLKVKAQTVFKAALLKVKA